MKMEHDYVSTACKHELHDRCRLNCKFCSVRCKCECHKTGQDIRTLERGDVIRHSDGSVFVVLDKVNGKVVASQTITVTNPDEWTVVKRHNWQS